MKKTYLTQLGVAALLMVIFFAPNVHSKDATFFRIVPIPKEDHGYSNFESTVITSHGELDAFLQKDSKGQGMGWNNRLDFENALTKARLDFNQEALVLLRHTESSGSVQVNFRKPRLKGRKLICRIDRNDPKMGTTNMAYYCFALVVVKTDIKEVELNISGKKPIILSVRREQPSNKTTTGYGK